MMYPYRPFVVIVITLLLLSASHTPTYADEVTVSSCDFESLVSAVATANTDGGVITFDCEEIILFTDALIITGDVTIIGGENIIFDGGGDMQFFTVYPNASLTLDGVTIQNGYSEDDKDSPIIVYNRGTLTITNSTFSDNVAVGLGGVIYNDGTVDITESTFSNNSAQSGGVIYNFNNGILTITDSTFSENSAVSIGGAIANINTLTITDSTFSENSAQSGGAIVNGGTVDIATSTFTDNSAQFGGAITNIIGTLTSTDNQFSTNTAESSGGAIFNSEDAIADIITNTFTDNSADYGGAITNIGTLTSTDSQFSTNTATIAGGAIANLGTLTSTDSQFTDNTAEESGGAIYNEGMVTSTDSHYENNTCDGTALITDNGGNTAENADGCPSE